MNKIELINASCADQIVDVVVNAANLSEHSYKRIPGFLRVVVSADQFSAVLVVPNLRKSAASTRLRLKTVLWSLLRHAE